MTQLLDRAELSVAPDSPVKTTYHWLGPIVSEESGRVVRPVYRSDINPLSLTDRQRDKLEPIARVIITSPQEKAEHPDAPGYMTHIPGPGSRQERQKLQEIIAELDPLSSSLPQLRNS